MFTIDAVGSGLCAAQLQVNADEKARWLCNEAVCDVGDN